MSYNHRFYVLHSSGVYFDMADCVIVETDRRGSVVGVACEFTARCYLHEDDGAYISYKRNFENAEPAVTPAPFDDEEE